MAKLLITFQAASNFSTYRFFIKTKYDTVIKWYVRAVSDDDFQLLLPQFLRDILSLVFQEGAALG